MNTSWSTAVTALVAVAALVAAFWTIVGLIALHQTHKAKVRDLEDLPGPAPVPKRREPEEEEIDLTDERHFPARTRLDALRRSSSGIVRITAIDLNQRGRRLASRRDLRDEQFDDVRAMFQEFEALAEAYLQRRDLADPDEASMLDSEIVDAMRTSGARIDRIGSALDAIPKLTAPKRP